MTQRIKSIRLAKQFERNLYLASDFLLFRLKNYNYSLRKTTICIHRINNLLFFPETPIKKTNIFLPKRSSSSFRILILTTYRQFIDIFHLQKSPKQSILQLLSSTNSFQPVHTTNRTSIRHDRAKFKVKTRVSVSPTHSFLPNIRKRSIDRASLVTIRLLFTPFRDEIEGVDRSGRGSHRSRGGVGRGG